MPELSHLRQPTVVLFPIQHQQKFSEREGLELSNRKEFYNLEREEEEGELTNARRATSLACLPTSTTKVNTLVSASETIEDSSSSRREIRVLF